MNCHICNNELTYVCKPYDNTAHIECRNSLCPKKMIVDRCCITYNTKTNEVFGYSLWIFEEKNWFFINKKYSRSNENVSVVRYKVEETGIGKYGNIRYNLREDPKTIIKSTDIGISICTDDDLASKIKTMIKRIKMLVMFT